MRKRLVVLVIACLLFLGFMGSTLIVNQSVAQDPPSSDITICHAFVNFQRPNGIVFFVGHLKTIKAHQTAKLAAHLNHGDVIVDVTDPLWAATIMPNMPCCSFSVLPDGTIVPGQVD